MSAKIRLYVDHPLGAGQSVPLNRDQAHYLFGVMRLTVGGGVLLFNGRDGEWLSVVAEAGKRGGVLAVERQTKPLQMPPDLWLLFAPIKKARTDFIVEKAAEMGAARIMPVQTTFTNADRIRQDRLQAHAVEAAEQCGGTFVPEVTALYKLDRLLADWPEGRQLMFCDEDLAGQGRSLPGVAAQVADAPGAGQTAVDSSGETGDSSGPWAILIGPEGGFSDTERDRLRALPFAHAISLGPRILRADTAAVAALALWQLHLGDW
ncbi:MAG: 16S rRNA (uracil1498-N3)-methyltransferase [Paracoccaceae bacterium]|jgi:16S rRNA (uracil1498-N3)-methyltransferase